MAEKFPQADLPRGLRGGADEWDDGPAGVLLRGDYFATGGGAIITPRAYTVASGTDLWAGIFAPTVPSWMGPVGEWTEISGTALSTSGVQQDFAGGSGVFAWGGAILNTVGIYDGATFVPGPHLCLWGGGHGDYSGNEIYALGPLDSNTPTWRRLRDRTDPPAVNVGETAAGYPVSRHTYQTISYDAGRNRMYSAGAVGRYSDGNGDTAAHAFDFAVASPNSNDPWLTLAPSLTPADVSIYVPAEDKVYSHPNAETSVQVYDVAANTWSKAIFKNFLFGTGAAHSALDPVRGIWCIVGSAGIQHYRVGSGTANDFYTPNTTGTRPTGLQSIVYDPVDDCFLVWNGNGKQLHKLTPPASNPYEGGNAWTWSSWTPSAGATPNAPDVNGTYGRFALVNTPNFRGCVLYNARTANAFFYRIA